MRTVALSLCDAMGLKVHPVDDPNPGVGMAKAAGGDATAAGWSHNIPAIPDFMKRACVAYFATIPEFAEFILR